MCKKCAAVFFVVQTFVLLYRFLMVLQCFKYIDMRTTEFVQLWKKLHILLETPLSMKLRALRMCSKNAQLFSFVVQLFKNILMMTREFVQLWRKLYILLQTPLPMKLRAKDSVKKVYSCFLCCTGFFWLYSFLKIYKGGLQNLYSFGKNCTFW